MKQFIYTLFFFCLSISHTKALDISITHATFFNGESSYIEVYLNITGKTAMFKPKTDSAHLQSSLEVLLLFKQGDKIVKFDKYNLQSPIVLAPLNFYDIKRYALPEGDYQLEAQVKDLYLGGEPTSQKIDCKVFYEKSKLQQSDIQLVKSIKKDSTNQAYSKNGLLMEPLAANFYDKNTTTLYIYNEIYNSDKLDDAFALSYSIYYDNNRQNKTPFAVGHKKFKPSATPIVFVGQVDIAKLPSGNYKLLVELRNRSKELLSSKEISFQRANPYLNAELQGVSVEAIQEEFVAKMTVEELKYSLRAIACKMNGDDAKDLNLIISKADPQAMKLRLFRYWAVKSPNQPEEAYKKYMGIARFVDEKYRSGFGYGFETDRGYVFLKYGRPDDIVEQASNPDTAPYEVWVYYDFPITGQKNIKFIFYDAEGSGSMRMLNSNARGEIQDQNWRAKLYKNVRNQWDGNGFDNIGIQDNVGRNADKILEDF
jgi:GWxTD domain-containing protein